MRNIDIPFQCNIDPDEVLTSMVGKLRDVVVIGRGIDGVEHLVASQPEYGEVLWQLDRARHNLISLCDEEE